VGPYIPYDPLQTKGEMCAKFGSDRFRNVDWYKFHTNKQTFIFIYMIMWRNMVERGRPQMTIYYCAEKMRIACYGKNTDTHSEYLLLIAFPRQQWLHERGSVLGLYAHCLYCFLCLEWDKDVFGALLNEFRRGKPKES
jgi:hypothetical protein